MPQLNFLTYTSQIFWLAISFSVLYFMLSRFFTSKVDEVKASREVVISEDISFAETSSAEIASIKAEVAIMIEAAKSEALNFRMKAIEESKEAVTERLRQFEKELNKNIATEYARLATFKGVLGNQLQEIVEPLSTQIVNILLDTYNVKRN